MDSEELLVAIAEAMAELDATQLGTLEHEYAQQYLDYLLTEGE